MESSSRHTTESISVKTKVVSATSSSGLNVGLPTPRKASTVPAKNSMRMCFHVKGNGVTPNGNAMAKIRLTGNQQWMPKAQRYATWKNHVLNTFLATFRGAPEYSMMVANIAHTGKPLTTKVSLRAHMHVTIYWNDETHGDPEGVFGSVADALFKQDKYLNGSFEAELRRGDGAVDVVITLEQDN